jgi:diguanylate cyclase (GGDEF)-like protein
MPNIIVYRIPMWRGWLVLVLVLFLLSACASRTVPPQPNAEEGVLDLRNWDFARDGPVKLDGDWTFYWDVSKHSLTKASSKEFIGVPGSWTQLDHPAKGKAVYQLQILTSPGEHLYGLKLYELPQSYRLYLNDTFIVENGRYAETPEESSRSLVRPYVVFGDSSGSFDIWIEAVNLDERDSGPRRSIIFGLEQDVRKLQESQLTSDMLVMGILLIMALYHLGLYLQRRREMGSLLFGLLCLIISLRITVTEEHYLQKYFPSFPGRLEGMLDVFTFFVLAPIFTWIFAYFFEQDFQRVVLKWVTGVFLVFSFVYLLFPVQFLFNFYLLFTLGVGLYLLYVLFLSVKNRRAGSRVFLGGFLLFLGTTIWDMLSYSNFVRSVYVSQIGFVAFIFAQAYVLSMRFNRALATSENLTQHLETLVSQRTSELEDSNRKLAALNITDALTGISNRRHFDERLESEWNRARRNGQPLALLLLDIDHFKAYNDHYGHQGGDTCLQTVAKLLAATVHRAGDTVARYGGEEFVVLLPDCTEKAATALAEKIRHTLEIAALPHVTSDLKIVSVSVGVKSIVPSETTSPHHLIAMADAALYQSKKQGRNRVSVAL